MSIAVVIPTKDRFWALRQLIPSVAKAGYDEVIVVDSSGEEQQVLNETLCHAFGIRYVFIEANREEARNLGAGMAASEWIYFLDDDGLIPKRINKETLPKSADFISEGSEDLIWTFRREFFLKIGGYDETLCIGDDADITSRARAAGRAGILPKGLMLEASIVKRLPSDDVVDLFRNSFLYGSSKFAYFSKHPSPSLKRMLWFFYPGLARRVVLYKHAYSFLHPRLKRMLAALALLEIVGMFWAFAVGREFHARSHPVHAANGDKT
jgi:glycosyltransferase involved in cell wall biosynthesis